MKQTAWFVVIIALAVLLAAPAGGASAGAEVALEVVTQSQGARWPQELVGLWHGSPVVGAGYDHRYLFEGNGVFTYAANQMTGAQRLRYSTGIWWVEDDILTLSAASLLVIEGGVVVDGRASMINDIEGGTLIRRELAEEERVVEAYPLAFLGTGDDTPEGWRAGQQCVQIGGFRLFSLAGPVEDMLAFRGNDIQ